MDGWIEKLVCQKVETKLLDWCTTGGVMVRTVGPTMHVKLTAFWFLALSFGSLAVNLHIWGMCRKCISWAIQ